jgi:hypothetical protein
VANEACSTEYESGTSSGYWQEVRANSHRTNEQNGASVDHSEGADDACGSHQDEVPTRRTSLNTRLREHIGPNECQRLGLIRPGADCVQPRENDIVRRDAQPCEQCKRGVCGIRPDIRGHECSSPTVVARHGHVSCSSQIAKTFGDGDHRSRVSVHSQL